MTVAPGTRLGPYEIVAPIGAGGMGEVYRARDTRLDRSVAIKVLPAEFAANAQLRTRFQREARTISQLSHPHICTLFDVGDDYLVMELLDGETLSDRLSRGALPLPEALQMAIEIADALDRAHRAGVVHRDLKPGNIMITSTGVKLLDFGLAKSGVTTSTDPNAATLQKSLTAEGTVVGTLQYMAPEQLEGRDTDARADIFALGAILYEMVSGRRAFDGESRASIIAKILGTEPPPLASVMSVAPPALDRIIKRCLVKHPALRWQCAGDVRRELELMEETPVQSTRPARSRALLAMLGVLAALVAAEGLWIAAHRAHAASERPVRFTIEPQANSLIQMANAIGPPALSPDGRSLAFVVTDQSRRHTLWVRDFASVESRQIDGTDGAACPFWSPDSRSIGFFAGGKLKRVDLDGSTPLILADVSFPRGGAWGADGRIVFSPSTLGAIYRVSARGGAVEQVTRLDTKMQETTHRWPAFLPDGQHILAFVRSAGKQHADAIWVFDLRTGARKLVAPLPSMARYSNGSIYYVRDRTLFAHPFDTKSMQLQGEPIAVVDKVQAHGSGFAMFSISDAGVLCYQNGFLVSELRLIDRHGSVLGTYGEPAEYSTPTLDAARKQFVVSRADPTSGTLDVWQYDMDRNVARRVTFDPGDDWSAVISPDGQRVAFSSNRSNYPQIYIKEINGAEPERQIGSRLIRWPLSWSADGRFIVYKEISDATQDIDILDLKTETARPFVASPFAETDAALSPAGRWLAYVSDESGRPEIYVTSFPAGAGRWQVTSGGGSQPRWRGDERELYYCAPDGTIVAVPVETQPTFKAGLPQRLFASELRPSRDDLREYDVSPDGEHFLVNSIAGRQRSLPLTIAVGAQHR